MYTCRSLTANEWIYLYFHTSTWTKRSKMSNSLVLLKVLLFLLFFLSFCAHQSVHAKYVFLKKTTATATIFHVIYEQRAYVLANANKKLIHLRWYTVIHNIFTCNHPLWWNIDYLSFILSKLFFSVYLRAKSICFLFQ